MSVQFNKKGFTLIEMLVVTAVLAILLSGIFLALEAGRDSWLRTEAHIALQEKLNIAAQRISQELRASGRDAALNLMVDIQYGDGIVQGTGVLPDDTINTDVLDFSVPITCQSDTDLIDENGDVQYWGAPATWGCREASCMDPENNCALSAQRGIEYAINEGGDLVRRVYNSEDVFVQEDVLAGNLVDFQVGCPELGQLKLTDLAMTADSKRLTSLTGGFLPEMADNNCIIYISGGPNFNAGCYEINSYISGNAVTLYENATNGSNATSGNGILGGESVIVHMTAQKDEYTAEACLNVLLRNY